MVDHRINDFLQKAICHRSTFAKLQHFTQLSLTLTKLCHVKSDHHLQRIFTYHLKFNCTDFIANDKWPQNPDLNPLDYYVWGTMLQAFHKLNPKTKTIPELKSDSALQQIWDDLPQTTINKAIKFTTFANV